MKKMFFSWAPALIGFVMIGFTSNAQNGVTAKADNIPPTVDYTPKAGGSSAHDIVSLTSTLRDNGTLTNAFKAAGMENSLKAKGPFTVFAPNNIAFQKLPAGFVEQLMKPENSDKLAKILSYHVIAGKMDINSVRQAIKAGHGRAEFTTLCGNKLIASIEDNKIKLTDDGDNSCFITVSDLQASNGIIHVLDKVALPR